MHTKPRRPAARCLLGGLTLALTLAGAARASDLTDLPLERLLETEVLSAARFARQVTDAASAVSVLTAQDIRALGLRTLGEVLDQMRGLHVGSDLRYGYLGARGVGGPGMLAGRVMLLIDGQPAVDNLYDQLYLGHDSILDPALIERIEYAPGGGSAMYGHNAFLGVVNVQTRQGRDLNGWEAAVSAGANSERQLRLSGGQRLASGAEWLASLTLRRDDGLPGSELGHQPWPGEGRALQWLLKGRWQGWTAQALGMRHSAATRYGEAEKDIFIDASHFVSVGHDRQFDNGWRGAVRLQGGTHLYRYEYDSETRVRHSRVTGHWWEVDTQAGYEGWAGHALVLGARWRQDPLLRYQRLPTPGRDAATWHVQRQSLSVSAEDRVRLRDDLHLTLGLRLVQRNGDAWTASPRHALVWALAPRWDLKWSHGRSARFASVSEEDFGDEPLPQPEQVQHRELGLEYRGTQLRGLATVYHFRMNRLLGADAELQSQYGRGLELEGEWQSAGWRLRGSQAWQQSGDNLGRPLSDSPRSVSKLQLSAPLGSERWRLSATVRHTAASRTGSDWAVPSSTRVDLTLLATRWLKGLDLRVGLRNLTDSRAHGQDESFADDPAFQGRRNRHLWVELGGSFQ